VTVYDFMTGWFWAYAIGIGGGLALLHWWDHRR
jgi:hypothetical protein